LSGDIADDVQSSSIHKQDEIITNGKPDYRDNNNANHNALNTIPLWKERTIVDDLADDIYNFESESDDDELYRMGDKNNYQSIVDDLADEIQDSEFDPSKEKVEWEDIPDLDDVKFRHQVDVEKNQKVAGVRSVIKKWSDSIVNNLGDGVDAQLAEIPNMEDRSDTYDHDYDSDGNERKEVIYVPFASKIMKLLQRDH